MESGDANTNEPQLCKNCKGFYGCAATDFLCSGCFKQQKEEDAKNGVAVPQTAMQLPAQVTQPTVAEETKEIEVTENKPAAVDETSKPEQVRTLSPRLSSCAKYGL